MVIEEELKWEDDISPFDKIEAVVQRCSVKKGVLRNLTKFTGKHLCQSLFFNKVAGLQISKNTFLHRIPQVAASNNIKILL